MDGRKDVITDEFFRQAAERNIDAIAGTLVSALAANEAQTRPGRRVRSSTLAVSGDGGFVAVGGSAHRMGGLFRELFRKRPELRSVVQGALDEMYKVDIGFMK